MDVLVGLMLQLKVYNGQAIQEENEINLLIGFPEIEVWPERDAVLGVFLSSGTGGGAWLGVEEPEFQPSYIQPITLQQPERRMFQFLAKCLEHFLPRICAVVILQ